MSRASWYGTLAFIDGLVPFGDPLQDYYSDGTVVGLEYSQTVGEVTRDTELTLALSASTTLFGKGSWLNTGKWVRVGHSTQLVKGAQNRVYFSLRGKAITSISRALGSAAASPHWNLWVIRFIP